mgnify:FL=1
MLTGRLLALDIETTGLDPFKDELLLIQLGTKSHTLVIDCRALGEEINLLAPLLASDDFGKLGHNLSFDCYFLEVKGLKVRGPLVDTFLASKVETAGEPEGFGKGKWGKGNSLKAIAERWLGRTIEEKKELQESFIGLKPDQEITEEMLAYAANDVAILFELHEAAGKVTQEEEIFYVWQLECRALPAIVQMKVNGMKLDVPYYKALLEEESKFREDKKAEVISFMEQAGVLEQYRCPLTQLLLVHPQYSGKGKGKTTGFNLASPTQLGPVLVEMGIPLEAKVSEKTGKTSYSCDKNVLAFHMADHEILKLYTDYKKAATRTQMVDKLIKLAEAAPDGRIHADYNQIVRSGRMSSREPNAQNIPKEPRYRKGFIAEYQRVFVRADYSQLEVRLVAEVSNDEVLLGIYNRGEDVHTSTAMLMTGKPADQIQKSERSAAKAISFGAIYGCSARTLRQTAISMFGISWTMDQAQEALDAWKDSYPGIVKWHQTQGRQEGLEVRTVFGRRRKLQRPRKKTKANGLKRDESNYTRLLNSPIQGLGADILKAALALLWEQYLCNENDIKLVAVVHDEIILEAPESRADDVKQILQECMEDAAPMVGVTKVPVVAEPSAGRNWGEV